MTKSKQQTVKAIKLDFDPTQKVTSLGGLAFVKRILLRLGVENKLMKKLPPRRGYNLTNITINAVNGLLSGAQGTVATETTRQDPALLSIFGFSSSPHESTFWRSLEDAGSDEALSAYQDITLDIGTQTIKMAKRPFLMDSGFLPVFIDGTLLEGSDKREGVKYIKDKGTGLMWTVGFVGPLPVAQRLSNEGEGEGEATHARSLIEQIDEKVLVPTKRKKDALVLMDSLHGNGPTLDILESRNLLYIVGVRGLVETDKVLSEQPESQWSDLPEFVERHPGIEEASICVASLQCGSWATKRRMVGIRWMKKNEMLWQYAGVVTNIDRHDKRLGEVPELLDFAMGIYNLYKRKGACENHFKNLLEDLGLHNPPCQEWKRNAGYYAIGTLAGLIGIAMDVLARKGKVRRRINTLRRWLFTVPARVTCHSRTAKVTILGLSDWWRTAIAKQFDTLLQC